jgi:DNA-binding MarR family transcriptional regulator
MDMVTTQYRDTDLSLALLPFGIKVASEHPELSMRQVTVMAILMQALDDNECTVRAIAKRMNTKKPCITRAADTLTKYGLIRRRKEGKDRRSVVLELTAQGTLFFKT